MISLRFLTIPLIALCCFTGKSHAQIADSKTHYRQSIKGWQSTMNSDFMGRKSPLTESDLKNFQGLPFFRIAKHWRLEAQWERCDDSAWFGMPTSTDRLPMYRKYATLTMRHRGKALALIAYQSQSLMTKDGYEDHLFIPFADASNGHTSYGGGRYIDINKALAKSLWVIDFNKSYNPYCAYSGRYSCPSIPSINRLHVAIGAGVKAPHPHD